jgi:hypothetical protein
MRKGTALFLSILLAVAVASTAADAKKKKMRHHKMAATAQVQDPTDQQRMHFLADAINPMGAKSK